MAGAEDVVDSDMSREIYTKHADLESVKKSLIEKGLSSISAEISKKPTTTVEVTDPETAKKILELMGKLEDLDDVQKVWSNFDIAENLLSGIQSSMK